MNFRRRPRNDLGHCKVCCAYDLITQSLDFSFLHSSSALWCERVVGVDITARIFGYAMLMRPTNKVHTTGLVQACVHWLQTLFGVNVSGGPVTLCPSSSTQTPWRFFSFQCAKKQKDSYRFTDIYQYWEMSAICTHWILFYVYLIGFCKPHDVW